MKEAALIFSHRIDQFCLWVASIAAWSSLALVLVVVMDVVYRRVLSDSQSWVGELEWHIFALIFLLGSAYTMQVDRHVRVDLFYEKMSLLDRRKLNLCGHLAFVWPWTWVVILYSLGFVGTSYVDMEGSPNPNGMGMRWLIKSMIPFGFLLIWIQSLSEVIKLIFLKNKINSN